MSDIMADKQLALQKMKLSTSVEKKLDVYVNLLIKEQQKMNLIADSTVPVIWTRHVLDSAQVFSLLKPSDNCVVDFGTGAGFPALVLAIMDEDKKRVFHLIESEGRKCDFLKKVADELSLNVKIHNERIEKIKGLKADLITARALAALDKLIKYALPFSKKETRFLFLKGKKADEELLVASKKWRYTLEKVQSISSDEGKILLLSEVSKK